MATCSSCGTETAHDFRFCPECGTQWVDDLAAGDPLIGKTLGGKYRVVETIGSGSMGRVYLAEHTVLKKRVALKVLHRDLQVADDAIARFHREGIAAGQISHPSVLQIFDFERADDGLCYLAMEYVDGPDLKHWLGEYGPVAPEKAIELMRQILGSLAEAHRHGVIHRDLKPENIMIVENPTTGTTVKVLDFGLSKLVDTPLDLTAHTIPGRLMGTPLYMAPEQWRGEQVDHRSDLYAATLVMFEMLAGTQPFVASDLTEIMVKATQHEPPSLSESCTGREIPPALEVVVRKGLEKKREDRYQSATEMIEALDAVSSGSAPVAKSAPKVRRPRRQAPERDSAGSSALRPALISVGAVAAIAAVWMFGPWGGDDTDAAPKLLSTLPAEQLDAAQAGYVSLLGDARARIRERDAEGALNLIDKAVGMPCADAEAYCVRAHAMSLKGDDGVALLDYGKALAMYPKYAEAEAGIGWVQFDADKVQHARKHFEAAFGFDPTCPDAIAGKGAALLRGGDARAARKILELPAAQQAENARLSYWLGVTHLELDLWTAAGAAFSKAKQLDRRMWQAYEGRGDAFRAERLLGKAEDQYREAMDLAPPTVSSVRRKYAECLVANEKYALASDALQPVLESGEADGETWLLSAVIATQRGKRPEAIQGLTRALDEGCEDSVRANTLLASLHAETQNWTGARDACARVAESTSDLPAALLVTWGIAQFRLQEHYDAAEKLERALEIDGSDLFARYTLGVIYMDYVGDADLAREQFQAYLDGGGTDMRVVQWLQNLGG